MEKKQSKLKTFMIIVFLVLSFLPQVGGKLELDVNLWSYYVIPTLWCVGIFLYVRFVNKVHTRGKLKYQSNAKAWAFAAGGVLVITRLLAGAFIDELGTSPYDHSLSSIIKNSYYIIPGLVSREIIRAYFMNDKHKDNKIRMFLVITLCMTVVDLKYSTIMALDSFKEGAIYILHYLLPVIIENVFLNILALYGGSSACILYRGILFGFEWLFPILPVLQWFTEAVISIGVVSIFSFLIYDQLQSGYVKKKREDNKGLGLSLTLSVAMIWFFAGVFPIYPSIVLTGSMEPLIYPGDIILIDKITTEEAIYQLKEGDIVNFSRGDITITHRIVEIIKDEAGNLSFRTKGDNNPNADTQLVEANEMKGTILQTIPKFGLPLVWLKSNEINTIEEEVNQP